MGLFDFGKKKREAAEAAAQASYEGGMRAYERAQRMGDSCLSADDYRRAVREFQPAAEAGHAGAQYMMGWLCLEEHCYDERGRLLGGAGAARWFDLAAKQGHREAQFKLGQLYAWGSGVERDYDAAFRNYEAAAAQDHPEAWQCLGECYNEGWGCPQSRKKAMECWHRGGELGELKSQITLGEKYRAKGDKAEAEKWFRLAEEQGSTYAADQLDEIGVMSTRTRTAEENRRAWEENCAKARAVAAEDPEAAFRQGEAYLKDGETHRGLYWLEAAAEKGSGAAAYARSEQWRKEGSWANARTLHWLERAAKLGYPEAIARLGWTLAIGALGVQVDLKRARILIQQAADAGNATAIVIMKNIDRPMEAGEDLYAKGKKGGAREWFRVAAESGDTAGMLRLAQLYLDGDGVKQNTETARSWLRRAGQMGDPEAAFRLGRIAYQEKEFEGAVRWWRRAAESGAHGEACCQLAWAYALGEGVKMDDEKMCHWARQAAACGCQAALPLTNLKELEMGGLLLLLGEAFEEAARFFRVAALRGFADSQYHLGRLYDGGQGVEKDREEAMRWYVLAAEQGHVAARGRMGMHYAFQEEWDKAIEYLLVGAEKGEGKDAASAAYGLALVYWHSPWPTYNVEEARRWAKVAADTGVEEAEELLREMEKRR